MVIKLFYVYINFIIEKYCTAIFTSILCMKANNYI